VIQSAATTAFRLDHLTGPVGPLGRFASRHRLGRRRWPARVSSPLGPTVRLLVSGAVVRFALTTEYLAGILR
jgi:hypothetical protein